MKSSDNSCCWNFFFRTFFALFSSPPTPHRPAGLDNKTKWCKMRNDAIRSPTNSPHFFTKWCKNDKVDMHAYDFYITTPSLLACSSSSSLPEEFRAEENKKKTTRGASLCTDTAVRWDGGKVSQGLAWTCNLSWFNTWGWWWVGPCSCMLRCSWWYGLDTAVHEVLRAKKYCSLLDTPRPAFF